MPLDLAFLILLAGLICAIMFIGNVHMSGTRLVLLFGVSSFTMLSIPAVRSFFGPGPGVSAAGEMVMGSDGKPMYTAEVLRHWARATAAEDAVVALAGFVWVICAVLLLVRVVTWYREKRDEVV